MLRREMLDKDEGHARVRGEVLQHAGKSLKTSGGGANADYGEKESAIFIRLGLRRGLGFFGQTVSIIVQFQGWFPARAL